MYCQANACHTPRPTLGGLEFIHMNKSLGAASEPSIVWACLGTREDARKWILAPASKPQWPSHWWELAWGPLPPIEQNSPLVGASLDQITKKHICWANPNSFTRGHRLCRRVAHSTTTPHRSVETTHTTLPNHSPHRRSDTHHFAQPLPAPCFYTLVSKWEYIARVHPPPSTLTPT